jgi:hypothetical protein
MKDNIGTETDTAAHEWAINDRVKQLRMWGAGVIYPLPTSDDEPIEPIAGSAATCLLRLNCPQVSREHAAFVQRASGWAVRDREWVRKHSAASLPDIEKGTRRLIAVRVSRNVSVAAERLGMAPVSLSRWIGRRGVIKRDAGVVAMEASRRVRRSRRRSAQA